MPSNDGLVARSVVLSVLPERKRNKFVSALADRIRAIPDIQSLPVSKQLAAKEEELQSLQKQFKELHRQLEEKDGKLNDLQKQLEDLLNPVVA